MTSRSRHGQAAALLIAAGAMLTLEVVVLRHLGDRVGFGQILLFRSGVQLVHTVLWIAMLGGLEVVRTERPAAHTVRGLLSVLAWLFYYASFLRVDMALASGLSFTSQIFVVLLAGPVLGERLTWLRIACTLVGFCGIAIASSFWDARAFDGDIVFGLLAAVCGAAIILTTRSLARTERSVTMLFYIGLATFMAALPAAWATWQPLALMDLGLLLLLGVLGYIAMWLMIEAYGRAEATELAAYPYTRLLFAGLAGYLVFGEVPPSTTLIGAALIVVATLTLTLAERNRRSSAQDETGL